MSIDCSRCSIIYRCIRISSLFSDYLMSSNLRSMVKPFVYFIVIVVMIAGLIFFSSFMPLWTQFLVVLSLFGIVLMKIFEYQFNQGIAGFLNLFYEIFQEKPVKQAMSVLGKMGGQSKREKAVVDKIATDVMSGPQLSGLKMAGKAIGVDVDDLIEEYGAVETLAGLQQLGSMLGINVQDLMGGLGKQLNTTTGSSSKQNPYLSGGS